MPVVAGIDAFRDAMVGFEDKYVLIGGGSMQPSLRGNRDVWPCPAISVRTSALQ